VLFVVARNLSPVGRRALVAIRDNHIAAEAMGIDNALYKSWSR
jgi:ABC-type branched-subunit amino acid transport system permease subunit